MKILFVAGEAMPFVKTGGLGDVANSLPKELVAQGHDCRVMVPKYIQIPEKYRYNMRHLGDKYIWIEHHNEFVGIDEYVLDGVIYYFVDAERYFNRYSVYGENDDCERFTFFAKAVTETMDITGFVPEVVHCNDWHTGLVPIYLKERWHSDIRTVFTIHNLRFQGRFHNSQIEKILELPRWKYYYEEGFKYYDDISFMKAGIVYSDVVTTVSHTYAQEIKTPEYGEGLEGLFRRYDYKLAGVMNGIDMDVYKRDRKAKSTHKKALQEKLGLEVSADIPLMGMITRLDRQKGVDLVIEAFDRMMETGMQFVLLGTGERYYEDFFRWKERQYPGRVCSYIGFDSELSKEIYEGSDMFLMPSIFEPCGLSQMIAMRYGCIPIVRETGGLVDTVTPYDENTGVGDGFGFRNVNAEEMLWCIRYAISTYWDKDKWKGIVANAKARDNSWREPARIYGEIYEEITR